MMEREGSSVAFLDLLSCSLGASILLFLIFSTLQHQGAERTRPSKGPIHEGEIVDAEPDGEATDPQLPLLFRITVPFKGAQLDLIDGNVTSPPKIASQETTTETHFFLLMADQNDEALFDLRSRQGGGGITIDLIAGAAVPKSESHDLVWPSMKLRFVDRHLGLDERDD